MSIFITQTACAYAAAPPSPKQHSRTSSAFSISAKPDEDWNKISDLVERRWIQNRIAQRNYRLFWKPEPCTTVKPVVSQDQFIYSMVSTDRPSPGIYSPRARSDDTSTEFSSSTYSASDKIVLDPNDHAQAYPTMTMGDIYHNYTLASIVPMMFPSIIHASTAIEREPYQAGDELTISAAYHYTPPMSFNAPFPYDQPNFHAPDSSDRSSNCSEAGYEYTTEPLSMLNGPVPIHPQRETEDYICHFHLNPARTTTMTKTWFPVDHENGQMQTME